MLLGDAAHAMTPDLGQGGGQALEDAATLVRLLTGAHAGGMERALDRYDALRRPRTARLLRTARRVGAVAQATSPVSAAVRDGVLRLLPDAWTASQVAAVQRWEPPPVGAGAGVRSWRPRSAAPCSTWSPRTGPGE